MRLVSNDRISNIVIMRDMNIVTDNDVLKLYGVSDNELAAYKSAASDEST